MPNTTLYLAEKADIAKYLAKGLGGGQKANGGIVGDGWIITWARGHLLTTYAPHDYDEAYKKWSWDNLPIIPDKIRFKVTDDVCAKMLTAIRGFAKKADTLVIATDPDREGELIAYTILKEIGWNKPTKRLWLTDTSPAGVKKALTHLKDAEETKPMYFAAMSRTYADWLVGMNLSRAATLKLTSYGDKPMSVGRVQTPVLGLIVEREKKIKNFKPEDYYELLADVQTANGALKMKFAPPAEKRIKDIKIAKDMQARSIGSSGPISVKTEALKQAPPGLFDLTLLQQKCNAKFGWSADKTLKIAQTLYDTHHYLTYPRTDCRVLPEEHVNNIPEISENLSSIPELSSLLTPEVRQNMAKTIRKSIYNDEKVTAHFAIIPTSMKPDINTLSSDETKLYLLVVKHWIAAHLPDMEYLQTSVQFKATDDVLFRASGRQITNPGWKYAFGHNDEDEEDDDKDDKEENAILPPLKDGENAKARDVKLESKKTKAPVRFTEKTLLSAMSGIASFVEDPKAKKTLKDTSGIGTPATRAGIIETLKTRSYITTQKKQLVPTNIAFTLIDSINATAPNYSNPVMTAQWEDVLEMIANGRDIKLINRFIDGIATMIRQDISTIKDKDLSEFKKNMPQQPKKAFSGPSLDGNWQEKVKNGTPIKVSYDDREKAKTIGARWNGEKNTWVIPQGVDPEPFKKAGYLK